MAATVVVIGSGYAGAGAINELEATLHEGEADLVWISDVDHHLVLHESHRIIRDPSVADLIAIPIEEIKAPSTRFVQGTAVDVDSADRAVHLDDGTVVEYTYLVVCVGTRTAFFGIDGLETHAHTLKDLADARGIHDALVAAGREASADDPATVVVGGAGLSGIQCAGEIAAYRTATDAPLEVTLVEGLDRIFPNNDPVVQARLRKLLEAAGVDIRTGAFIGEVDEDTVYLGAETELPYDVLVWTGGITGRALNRTLDVDRDERSHRIEVTANFQTADDRIFALGDSALLTECHDPTPPTAQSAWQAAAVAGRNVARAIRGQPLEDWRFQPKGTLISVGDEAIAHDVMGLPIETFGGRPAAMLKKAVACRWIADVTGGYARAVRAWPDM